MNPSPSNQLIMEGKGSSCVTDYVLVVFIVVGWLFLFALLFAFPFHPVSNAKSKQQVVFMPSWVDNIKILKTLASNLIRVRI